MAIRVKKPVRELPLASAKLVTYAHLTTERFADDILVDGIRPITGAQSGNDKRFFTVTMERGPEPRPNQFEARAMLASIRKQLTTSHPNEPVALVLVRLPVEIVELLENNGVVHYGSFFPRSQFPPYTESIFETESFQVVNRYRELWQIVPLN